MNNGIANKQQEIVQAQQRLKWLIDKGYLTKLNVATYHATVEPYTVGGHLEQLGYNQDSFTDKENAKLLVWQSEGYTPAEIDEAYTTAVKNKNHRQPDIAYVGGILSGNRKKAKNPAKQTKTDKPKKLSANRPHATEIDDIENTEEKAAAGRAKQRQELIDKGVDPSLIAL